MHEMDERVQTAYLEPMRLTAEDAEIAEKFEKIMHWRKGDKRRCSKC
jgi:hypothetical protein